MTTPRVWQIIVAIVVTAACGGKLVRAESDAVAGGNEPSRPIAKMKEREFRAQQTIQNVLPAIVAVDGPYPKAFQIDRGDHFAAWCASGVIISADGLVLSQWHVSHQGGLAVWRNPGDETDIILQDGRQLKAELLGADPVRDLSLLRIREPGEYPHLKLAKPNSVAQGDWVLKLGHPFGYRPGRGAVARLGRVIYLGESVDLVADCRIFAGDSGGPLLNLDGDVIGIVESSANPQNASWVQPARSGGLMCYTSVSTIERLMPTLLNPPRGDKPEQGIYVPDLPEFRALNSQRRIELSGKVDAQILPAAEWSQGEKTRGAWNSLTEPSSGMLVEVLRGERRVAYGTVIGTDGQILTKASEISDDACCRFTNGEVLSARVVRVDPAWDLALLKVEVSGLRAVELSDQPVRTSGRFVAAPDARGGSIGVGIVSVAQRNLEGPFPSIIRKAAPYHPKAAPPGVLGDSLEGGGLRVKRVKGFAASAGITSGDLILTANDQPIHQTRDLHQAAEQLRPGDTLQIRLVRNDLPVELELPLEEVPYVECPGAGGRYRNSRADDFPCVFEHDIPLLLDECGGPVIDLDGRVIGINIARVGEHGCMAIPADCIKSILLRWKHGDAAPTK
ncbi:trypsin-like peptidase domain-containing protein [Schlesneria paludicola]|uniref:trypsin-like peptidase domain-containing protein n=1 Tax=Schlesneria paludicola TaxID=360056 RepID=UPI00029B3DED|nr:trypsin-like peptidase domain-containing protein [Schlesneria paludicola]